jgi:aspartyl-tRNA synthetase
LIDFLGDWKRTNYCGELRGEDEGREVVLMGWVQRRRDHGGVIFVDLRDRAGVAQVVFNPKVAPASHEKAGAIRSEWVLAVRGEVRKRIEGMANPNLKTGEIEVMVQDLKILNVSDNPPFAIDEKIDVGENTRLRYRYLDLRRPSLQSNFWLRYQATKAVREYFDRKGFIEIETPFLTRSTPEGARDYLVPSRVNPGSFYALPQSPQLFKQILMVAGFDRYFQIVKCFRDEDLRMDRQPEFTQIDVEMSFVTLEVIKDVMSELMVHLFHEVLGIELELPFPTLTYKEAMDRFGSDRPDIRFGMELKEITQFVQGSEFTVFREALASGGIVKGLKVDGSPLSRKEIEDLPSTVEGFSSGGLLWARINADGWVSPVKKFLKPNQMKDIEKTFKASAGDLLLFVADQSEVVNDSLGRVRNHLGKKLGLTDDSHYSFTWIVEFPLLEYDETEKRYVAVHHPFTAPMDEDVEELSTQPETVRAKAYDMVLNGVEIGGGSIRNHRKDIQERVFEKLGIDKDEAFRRFGFLMEALSYGAPPHGGIAFGFDRLAMIMSHSDSIRDVIAFPKTQKAADLMADAPSSIDQEQLKELFIKITKIK